MDNDDKLEREDYDIWANWMWCLSNASNNESGHDMIIASDKVARQTKGMIALYSKLIEIEED